MKKWLLLWIALFAIIVGCQNQEVSYQQVSVEEAQQMAQQGNVKIIDVRTPEEYAEGHIPNAALLPLQELPERIKELDPTESYLIVCRSGNRSAQASDILIQNGFTHVSNMTGGMNEWKGEVEKGE